MSEKCIVASYKDIEKAQDELLLIANKYHLSLNQLDEVYSDVRETIENINPVVITPKMEFVCGDEI